MNATDACVIDLARTRAPIYKPGSISIRPTRADAERDSDAFYTLLDAVRGSSNLPLKKIALAHGDMSDSAQQNISRKINQRTLNEDARRAILKHIFEDENLLSGDTRRDVGKLADPLYFAFLNFMGTRETSQDNARACVIGTYKVWRFSVEHEDEFVLGKVVFTEDPKTRAVKVTMTQPKKPQPGVRGSSETLSGYFFRMSDVYMMMLHDTRNEDFRITLFPRFKFDFVGVGDRDTVGDPRSVFAGWQRHLVHLDGFGLGIDGNSGFFSPVHLSLVDDVDELAALDDTLDVIPEGDERMPDRIVKKLKRNGPMRRL